MSTFIRPSEPAAPRIPLPEDRPLCVFLTGPSGVGKSTLLRRAAEQGTIFNRSILVPPRHTTRTLRSDSEQFEVYSLSHAELASRTAHGEYVVQYCDYGHHYALPRKPFALELGSGPVLILQTLPTRFAATVRQRLEPDWEVRICMLSCDERTLRERLKCRGDKATLEQLEERLSAARSIDFRHLADISIDASGSPEEVFERFRGWLGSVCETPLAMAGNFEQ